MPIATIGDLKGYTRNGLAAADDATLQLALDTADFSVRHHVKRGINVATTSTARSYVPNDTAILRFADCTAVATIVDNGVTLAAGVDYQLEPVNAINDVGDTVPYEQARRLNSCWYSTVQGKATVVVTASWGWVSIPAWAKEATLILAADIFATRDQPGGVAGFGEYGAVRVREHPVVSKILAPHRRVETWGIG